MGHATRKPTSLVTNIELIKALDGLRIKGKEREKLQRTLGETLEERLESTKMLAEWAPGLVDLLVKAAQVNPTVRALSAKEKQEVEAWKRHCAAGHLPFRRDCGTCLEAAGKDRPRKKVPCPESFCMAVDLSGPFPEGRDQSGPRTRYVMVATVTVPIGKEAQGELPLVESLRALIPEREGIQVLEDEEEIGGPEELPDAEDTGDFLVGAERKAEQLGEQELQAIEQDEQAWKSFLGEAKKRKVRTLTLAMPLVNRKAQAIVDGVAQMYARLRALQIPVMRIHTDRAKEFVSQSFRRWTRSRGIYQTYTAGDEATGNARTERAIGLIKARARVMLQAAKADFEKWPLAIRQAGEELFRSQLRQLGVPAPEMLAFGKRKAWHRRGESWGNPMQQARVWGPADDMSISSHGYFVEMDAHFMRSTVVVAPKFWGDAEHGGAPHGEMTAGEETGAQQRPEDQPVLEESADQRPILVMAPHDLPRQRLRGKTSPEQLPTPGVHRVRHGGATFLPRVLERGGAGHKG